MYVTGAMNSLVCAQDSQRLGATTTEIATVVIFREPSLKLSSNILHKLKRLPEETSK